jgi:1-acyl-sn-glycerol-3-phosphate acyltransferase
MKSFALTIYSFWAYLLFIILIIPAAFFYAFLSLSPSKGRERRILYVNNAVAWLWSRGCFIRMSWKDHLHLQDDKAYVFVVNHSSSLDMLSLSYAARYGMRFLGKKELLRIPILGFMFSRMCVFVDRGDADSRKRALSDITIALQSGISICMFPEGTRNRGQDLLGKFYDGAFKAAIAASVPVVPLVMIGGNKVMPMGQSLLRPGTIQSIFLDPLPTADLGPEDAEELRDRVWQIMYDAIEAGPQDLGKKGWI